MTRDEIEALCDEIDRLEIPFGLARPVMLATSALRALAQENEALRQDRDLCERTRTNMRRILNDVAEALKGPPASLHAHDWSGLPALVRDLQADLQMALDSARENGAAKDQMQKYGALERERLRDENEALRADKERLRLFVVAVRDNASLCSPVCPSCEENGAFAIEVLHGAALDAARAGENTP